MNNTPIIACKNVTKEYKDANHTLSVLNAITMNIMAGDQIAIMGRSGSGKSTLLQILGGLDFASEGQVFIKNLEVAKLNEAARSRLRNRHLGFIYQFHHLLPEFSALENIALPLLIAGASSHKARVSAMELLEHVGLSQRANHKPGQLSGGERQRIAIARALANNPDCILADEPTGNLDSDTSEKVFDVMQNLNQTRKTSFVIVTHDLDLAKRLDKAYLLENGSLKEMI